MDRGAWWPTVHGVPMSWTQLSLRARAHTQRNINGTFFSPMYRSQNVQDWKRSVFIPIPKKGNAKECSNYCTIALISHTNKVMLNILQVRLQQYVNCELQDVQAGFRKGRGTRDQIANICLDHQKSKRVPEKHILLLY